ncbi:ferredoxin [Streptomyces sp. NBC_01190]|uniref:ferredoxin n=1 Tax=Streptomyces sp. NBC_01190 TaxID=2903767 RepID=UPI00386C3A4C|nr:ferredoxin [Streptomyces sp. NBC_01190]
MNISADTEKCCGAGQCVLAAPEVFDQREDDGVVIILDPSPGEEHRAGVEEAVQVCPAAALTLEGR